MALNTPTGAPGRQSSSQAENPLRPGHVVVGVLAGQPAAVVRTAATYALQSDADVVCAFVDPTRRQIGERADGTVVSWSANPELPWQRDEVVDPRLREAIASALGEVDVPWSVRALAGEPARELGRLADRIDATLIVVGTRRPGLRAALSELVNGSVAVQLVHHQHRPVLVVPLKQPDRHRR